jgi:hypothetical protein
LERAPVDVTSWGSSTSRCGWRQANKLQKKVSSILRELARIWAGPRPHLQSHAHQLALSATVQKSFSVWTRGVVDNVLMRKTRLTERLKVWILRYACWGKEEGSKETGSQLPV